MNPGQGTMAGKVLLAGAIILYPLAVYFLIDLVGPGALGVLLIVLLALRIKPVANLWPGLIYLAVPAALIAAAIALAGDGTLALKSYPTIISLILLAVFGYTLVRPPSMVERIARAARGKGAEFSARAESYTRAVTLMWCVFFALNALISALISIAGSLQAWTLYNGLIAYVMVGTLFAGELLFRRIYKRRARLTDSLS